MDGERRRRDCSIPHRGTLHRPTAGTPTITIPRTVSRISARISERRLRPKSGASLSARLPLRSARASEHALALFRAADKVEALPGSSSLTSSTGASGTRAAALAGSSAAEVMREADPGSILVRRAWIFVRPPLGRPAPSALTTLFAPRRSARQALASHDRQRVLLQWRIRAARRWCGFDRCSRGNAQGSSRKRIARASRARLRSVPPAGGSRDAVSARSLAR